LRWQSPDALGGRGPVLAWELFYQGDDVGSSEVSPRRNEYRHGHADFPAPSGFVATPPELILACDSGHCASWGLGLRPVIMVQVNPLCVSYRAT